MSYFNNKRSCDPKWTAGDEEHDAALAECGVAVEALCRLEPEPTRVAHLRENTWPAAEMSPARAGFPHKTPGRGAEP